MPISIESRLVVCGGHLKQPIMMPTQVVDDRSYFKLIKSDAQVARLLVPKLDAYDRPLSRTDIVERLGSLRNSAYHALLLPPDEGQKEDLGLDGPPKPRKASEVVMPTSILADVEVEGMDGIQMRMLLSKPGSPLWVEHTAENINFLIDVVCRQIASGVIKRVHPRQAVDEMDRVNSDTKGVSYSYKRQCVRVKRHVGGKDVTKYFKVETPAALDDALQDAEAWVIEHHGESSASSIAPL